MLTIRCTQKVLKKFKLQNHLETTPADPPAPGAITSDAPTSFLNEWYANLIRVDRRHMVGFMNRELTIEAGILPEPPTPDETGPAPESKPDIDRRRLH